MEQTGNLARVTDAGTALDCLPLFICRKSLVADTASCFLSGLSLFVESMLFTLVHECNDAPSVSVCSGLCLYDLGFGCLFFQGFFFSVFVSGHCSEKLRSELLIFSFKLLGFSFLPLLKSLILHRRNIQIG